VVETITNPTPGLIDLKVLVIVKDHTRRHLPPHFWSHIPTVSCESVPLPLIGVLPPFVSHQGENTGINVLLVLIVSSLLKNSLGDVPLNLHSDGGEQEVHSSLLFLLVLL